MTKLKLIAQTADDLPVISSAMQDAILKLSGITYDAKGRYLSLRMSRFMHERDKPARVESGLRIDNVLGLQSRGIERSNPEAFVVLLDMAYEAEDNVSGHLTLNFAGGGAMRLQIEAIDMILADIGEPRKTKSIPDHA